MTKQPDPTPIPESNFTWRRLFSYVAATALLAFVGWIIHRLTGQKELADTAFWVLVVLWWVITYYMVAPSAEQIARIIQSARLFQSSPDIATAVTATKTGLAGIAANALHPAAPAAPPPDPTARVTPDVPEGG